MNKLLFLLNMVVIGFTVTNIVLMNDINMFRIQDKKDLKNRLDKLNMFAISVCLIVAASLHTLMCVSMYMSKTVTLVLSIVAVAVTSYIAYFNEDIKSFIEGFVNQLNNVNSVVEEEELQLLQQQQQLQQLQQLKQGVQQQGVQQQQQGVQQQGAQLQNIQKNIINKAKDAFKDKRELIYVFNYVIVGASALFLLMMVMSMMGGKKSVKSAAAPVKKKASRRN